MRACKTFSQFCGQFGQSRSLLCNTLHLNATAPLHWTYSSEMWTAFLSNCGVTRSDCLATNLFLHSMGSSGRKRKREKFCIKPLCIYHWRKIAEFHPQCRHTIYRFRWIILVFVRAINLWFGLHATKTFWRWTALLVQVQGWTINNIRMITVLLYSLIDVSWFFFSFILVGFGFGVFSGVSLACLRLGTGWHYSHWLF